MRRSAVRQFYRFVLAEGWRRYAVRRLESGRVEDWAPRLEGQA